MLVDGWCFKDYIEHAALAKDGFEVCVVDGVQRAGKSNLSLQIGSWAKHAKLTQVLGRPPTEKELWEAVLDSIVFTPADFVNKLKEVPDGEPLDVIIWDDINAHYTNTAFKTDVHEYQAIDKTFTVIGTKVKVIISNIPNVGRLAKNIKDNCTFEIFVGKNKLRKMMRLFRLPMFTSMDMNLFKVDVEPMTDFNIFKIPNWAWVRYEAMRIELANKALRVLEEATNLEEAEGFIPIVEALKLCRDAGLSWGVSTVQQSAARGIFGHRKVGGKLHIHKGDLLEVLEAEGYTPTPS